MQTIAKILVSILIVLIFQRFVIFMNFKEKQLDQRELSILLDKQRISNYRLGEDNEDDHDASADEPFEPYYITEEDT